MGSNARCLRALILTATKRDPTVGCGLHVESKMKINKLVSEDHWQKVSLHLFLHPSSHLFSTYRRLDTTGFVRLVQEVDQKMTWPSRQHPDLRPTYPPVGNTSHTNCVVDRLAQQRDVDDHQQLPHMRQVLDVRLMHSTVVGSRLLDCNDHNC